MCASKQSFDGVTLSFQPGDFKTLGRKTCGRKELETLVKMTVYCS